MASQSTPARPLDVLLTLRLALLLWWRDFAPITLLGMQFMLFPALIARGLAGPGVTISPAAATIVQTILGVLAMLYVASVTFGIMSALVGRPLAWRRFILLGLGAAQPGLVVALVLGVGMMTLAIVALLGRTLSAAIPLAAIGLGLWGLAVLMPAVPIAVAERLGPLDALARARAVTRGNRWRLVGMVAIVAVLLVSVAGIVTSVIFGVAATPAQMSARAAAFTLADPGLWIAEIVDMLVLGIVATIPPTAYIQMVRKR